MPYEKAPSSGAFLPLSLMYFLSGDLPEDSLVCLLVGVLLPAREEEGPNRTCSAISGQVRPDLPPSRMICRVDAELGFVSR